MCVCVCVCVLTNDVIIMSDIVYGLSPSKMALGGAKSDITIKGTTFMFQMFDGAAKLKEIYVNLPV